MFFLNPFVPNAPVLYPLKTQENRKVFWRLQGVEKGCTEKKWVNNHAEKPKYKFPKLPYLQLPFTSYPSNTFVQGFFQILLSIQPVIANAQCNSNLVGWEEYKIGCIVLSVSLHYCTLWLKTTASNWLVSENKKIYQLKNKLTIIYLFKIICINYLYQLIILINY